MDESCLYCEEVAAGKCEACGAPLCHEHDTGEFRDVEMCSDSDRCEARLEAQEEEHDAK